MAAFSTQGANDFLNYFLRNTTPSWGGAGTLYLALHTGTLGLGGDQTVNEVAYTGYARVALTRSSGGVFTAAASGQSQNNAAIQFGNPTAGTFPIVATHASIGVAASGAGAVIQFTALVSSLTINLNVQPNLATSTVTFTLV